MAFGSAWTLGGARAGSDPRDRAALQAVFGGCGSATGLAIYQRAEFQATTRMSSGAQLAELQALRRDLAELSARVLALEEARVQQGESGPPQVTYSYTVTGSAPPANFVSVVEPEVAPTSSERAPEAPSGSQRPSQPRGGSVYYSAAERREVAENAGRFILRSLNGDHRGTSGREQLRLQSRVYLLFRDHAGHIYNPVKVVETLSQLTPLVKPHGDLGDSVFIGLPSKWEAKICAEVAGVAWPLDG